MNPTPIPWRVESPPKQAIVAGELQKMPKDPQVLWIVANETTIVASVPVKVTKEGIGNADLIVKTVNLWDEMVALVHLIAEKETDPMLRTHAKNILARTEEG